MSEFLSPENITIGDNVFIGDNAHFSGHITIGNNVMFGPRPMIFGGNHYFGVKGKSVRFLKSKNGENSKPVIIEDEVWCGAGVIILPGVKVGIGSVIGAGSVVSSSMPPFVLAVGNKCKPIKKIFSDKDLFEHLIKLGYSKSFAEKTVLARVRVLKNSQLDVIDITDNYWETKRIS